MQSVIRWALYRAARKSIATLASHGLVNEGIYLAVKTLAEGWKQPVADTLVSGFRSALAKHASEYNPEAWRKVIDSQLTSDLGDELVAQVAVQSLAASDFIKQGVTWNSDVASLGQHVVDTGTKLVNAGMFDAGLSLLSCAAYDRLAGFNAIPILRDAVARTPQRIATIVSGNDAKVVQHDLATTTTQLVSTDHYVSALHTRLLEPLMYGDNALFLRIGVRILNTALPNSGGLVGDTINLALDLCSKGYRGQAVDLVTASTGIPYADQLSWRRMFMAIDEPQHASSASRFAAKIMPPVAARAGLDLSPLSTIAEPAAAEEPPAARSKNAGQAPERHVNSWIEEDPSFKSDEFNVGVNIGPRQQGAMGGPFVEPDWTGRDHVELRIVLSGPDAQVRPAWRSLRLPKVGKTEDVQFRVKTSVVGILQLWLRVYADDTNMLLDEHKLRISIANERQVA